MTSIGRGRGTIVRRDPDKAPPPLRRPQAEVQDQPQIQVPLDILLAKIDVLDVNEGFVLNNIRKEIVLFCSSLERLDKFIECLHKRALDDRNFGHRAAVAICTTSLLSVDGHKLRNSLIKRLQNDYTNSETLQATNPERFLNAVAFLGEVFKFVRLANNMPIAVLLIALLDYQNRMVAGTTDEIELCVNMLALNSRTLSSQYNERLDALTLAMTARCLSDSLNPTSRCWLLLALHLQSSSYQPVAGAFRTAFLRFLPAAAVDRVNLLLALPDTIPLPWMDEAALDALKPGAAPLPSPLALSTSLPSPGGSVDSAVSPNQSRESLPSPGQSAPSEVAAVHQTARPRDTDWRGAEPDRWGSRPKSDWGRGEAGDKAAWGGASRGGSGGGGREERRGWGGGDREERERGNWGVREGQRRPRDDRDDRGTWLSKPTPSEKDIEAWGLRPARGRAYGHDDRFDVAYDDAPRAKPAESWG